MTIGNKHLVLTCYITYGYKMDPNTGVIYKLILFRYNQLKMKQCIKSYGPYWPIIIIGQNRHFCFSLFLAHLWGAYAIPVALSGVRRPSFVVRRPSSVVRRVSSVSTITTRNN